MLSTPAASTCTIAGLINKVRAYLQNRSDASESAANPSMRPSAWLQDALREITSDNPFEELRVTGPVQTIGPGLGFQGSNYAYPVSMFIADGDDVTVTEDPVIFLTANQAAVGMIPVQTMNTSNAGNVVAYGMDYLTPKAIQSLLFIPGGVPFKYTRYGSQYWFGPQPGQPYNVYLPYQRRHTFNPDILTTPVCVPQDWFEIVCIAAAERGATVLRWNDHAAYLHNLLYGDPKTLDPNTGKYARPGLIEARILQQERDRRISTIQIMPGAQRY